MCEVCEQAAAVWHTVTIIDHGRHEIHGNLCEECADDIAEAELVDTMVLL